MLPLSLIALPGFLGRKEDWQNYSADSFGVNQFHPMDLFEESSLKRFAKKFNNKVENSVTGSRILMGYSLGARLALHALLDNPSLWTKAVLISGHPGLSSKEEKEIRKTSDALWADDFIHAPWEAILAKWEAQAVFKTSTYRFERNECNYSRSQLAHCLTDYSLGMQEDLKPEIAELNLPILWLTGQSDEKFSMIAGSVVLKHQQSKKIALPGGHRIPWESEMKFKKAVYDFLKES